LAAGAACGCASAPDGVRAVAARNLHCAPDEIEIALNRETGSVREYAAGCNFMYTRVHCTRDGCTPAEVVPPCIGKMPCFEEDPETLKWHLASRDLAPSHRIQ